MGAGGGSVERWSFRLNLSDPAGSATLDEGLATDMFADCKAWAAAETGIWLGSSLDTLKLARIGPNGLYREDAIVDEFPAVQFAGGTTLSFPFQVALAISLDTGQRGPRKRGRVYLPTPSVGLETDGQFGASSAEGFRNRFATFLNNLNNAGGLDANAPNVTIASSFGFNTDVTSIRVGRVLDTQRRRRRSLPEDYTAPAAIS